MADRQREREWEKEREMEREMERGVLALRDTARVACYVIKAINSTKNK